MERIGEIGRAVIESSRDSRAFTAARSRCTRSVPRCADGGDQRETRAGNGCGHRLLVDVAAARDRRRVRLNWQRGELPVHIADGSVVQAKAVVLDTVRVGHFTAHNVECTVPPGVDKALRCWA